jgi:hypothetical protein
LSIQETPFGLDQKLKIELSFATTSYYNKTFSTSPTDPKFQQPKKKGIEGKFFGLKKNLKISD